TGSLPSGVTFTPATGVLAGTPSVTGTFPITFTASNGVGSPATQGFTLTVLGFHVSTSSLPNAVIGSAYSVQLQTQGGTPPYKWKKTTKLPKGLKLSSSGLLAGTPSKGPGSYSIGVMVTSNKTAMATATLPLIVDQAPAITSTSTTSFKENAAGSFTVTTSGFPVPTVAETGALPAGVTLTSGGVLSGTPTQSGTFAVTLTATNGIGSPASQSFTLTVIAPLVITTTSLPGATPGSSYTAQLAASGGVPPFKWKKLSALPKGLKLSSSGAITGTLSSKVAPGTYPVSAQVTDKEGKVHTSAQKTINLVVS
ncbi:MAG TPA: putative Ig domain-containing protein, partial [Acidimicrobiales bacterium]|nr:putative Ig domain-containing protein [Acidimicrobiales bacterium]